MKGVLKVKLSDVYTEKEMQDLAKLQKKLGLIPLDASKEHKIYLCPIPNCKGTLLPIGMKAFAVVCKCNKCGKKYRR